MWSPCIVKSVFSCCVFLPAEAYAKTPIVFFFVKPTTHAYKQKVITSHHCWRLNYVSVLLCTADVDMHGAGPKHAGGGTSTLSLRLSREWGAQLLVTGGAMLPSEKARAQWTHRVSKEAECCCFSLSFLFVINRNKLQSGWEWAGSGNGTPQRSRAWMCVAWHMDMAWMQDPPLPWASAYNGICVHSAHASMPAEVCLIYLGASGVEQSACNVQARPLACTCLPLQVRQRALIEDITHAQVWQTKLTMAQEISTASKIYLPHNVDFRYAGRGSALIPMLGKYCQWIDMRKY